MKIVLVSLDWDLIDLIEMHPELELHGVLDRSLPGLNNGVTMLGADEVWTDLKKQYPQIKALFAVDPPKLKEKLAAFYGEESIVGIISPMAHISKRATVHESAIIQHGAKIMPLAKLGKFCKIHINATVHHESEIGDYSTIAPAAQILGNVKIGKAVYVGAGAVIRQRIKIGDNAVIGAGAVVVADVSDNACVVGVPADRDLRLEKKD
ncbi:MAG: acetyltransferase [Candidatus Obscuribacterales bacterium]|nr:acetyltransferase [Candidatus Obscuribacterales bacterium]